MTARSGQAEQSNDEIGLTFPGTSPRIAILIPCFNEELTIEKVIDDFRMELPEAHPYVFDNNSTDHTVERARGKGATIFCERRQGKGIVVQSMFREINADIYVMVDGDGTYPAPSVHALLEPVLSEDEDMVVGSRFDPTSESQFRLINRIGNHIFLFLTRTIFYERINDMLSGLSSF